jgi:CRP-like cAMP-binding protein
MDFATDCHPMTQHQNEVLERSSLFRFLPEERADCLRSVLQEEHFEFGDVIVREGDEANACYILVNGRARVVKEIKDGQEIALAVLRPGDQFGEQALIDGSRRNATVRCSTAVDALRLNRADFLSLLTDHPDLKSAVELTSRHRTLHGFLHEFSNFGRLPERALRALVEKMTPISLRVARPSFVRAILPDLSSSSSRAGLEFLRKRTADRRTWLFTGKATFSVSSPF